MIDPSVFEIPSDYSVTRENFVDVLEEQRKKRRAQQGDPEMEQAISESLRELGWANDPQTRQAILESQLGFDFSVC